MKTKLAAFLVLALTWSAFASVAVAPPASPLMATLTAAQVQAFTSQVSGVPTGKTIRTIMVQVRPDGSGQLIVNVQ